MTKTYLQGAGVVLVLIALLGSLTLYAERAQAPADSGTAGSVTLTIEGLYSARQVSIRAGETALQVLADLDAQDPAVQLMTKEYAGLGTLVEGIGSLHNGTGGKYWQYTVDGVMPQVGAGTYVLNSGDAVDWFFAASQE